MSNRCSFVGIETEKTENKNTHEDIGKDMLEMCESITR